MWCFLSDFYRGPQPTLKKILFLNKFLSGPDQILTGSDQIISGLDHIIFGPDHIISGPDQIVGIIWSRPDIGIHA